MAHQPGIPQTVCRRHELGRRSLCVRATTQQLILVSVADGLCSPFQIFAGVYWWFWGYKTFLGPCPNLSGKRTLVDRVREDIKETSSTEDVKTVT